MPTIPIYPGTKRTIYAWGTEQSCAVVEFLLQLEADGNKDRAVLVRLYEQAGDDEPTRNREKCHKLEGPKCKNLFEFKASGGSRLVWFYGQNRSIILTHGVKKPKNNSAVVREECDPAQSIRMQYLEEQNG
jgi:hypothetical protein